MTSHRTFLFASLFVLGCGQTVREVDPPEPPPTATTCPADPLDLTFGTPQSGTILAGLSVAVDASCNLLLAGTTQGPIDFGGGPIGAAAEPFAFVAKLDPQGKHLWSLVLPPGAVFEGKDVLAVDGQGNIVVAGTQNADVDLGGGPLGGEYERAEHPFLLGLDANGSHVFSKRLAGNLPDDVGYQGGFYRTVEGTAFDPEGNFLIAGKFVGEVDLGGVTVTSTPFVIEGFPTNYKPDVFLAKYDAKGTLLWARSYGTESIDYGVSIDVTPSGEVYFLYASLGSSDGITEPFGIRLKKYASNGDIVWEKIYENSTFTNFGGILAVAEDGGVVLGGEGELVWGGIGAFAPAFVARLDANGEPVLGAGITGQNLAVVTAVAPDTNDGIRAVGWFDGTLLVHGQSLADASGGYDGFDMHVEWDDKANTVSAFDDAGDEVALAMARSVDGDRVIVGLEGPITQDNEFPGPLSRGTRIFLHRRR